MLLLELSAAASLALQINLVLSSEAAMSHHKGLLAHILTNCCLRTPEPTSVVIWVAERVLRPPCLNDLPGLLWAVMRGALGFYVAEMLSLALDTTEPVGTSLHV